MDSALIITPIIAALVCWLLVPLAARLSVRVHAVDEPADERRVHSKATPRLGGIAIAIAILVSSVTSVHWLDASAATPGITQMQFTLLGLGVALALGAFDDVHPLRWWAKLAGQFVVALVVVVGPLMSPLVDSLDQLLLPVTRIDLPLVDPLTLSAVVGIAISMLWVVGMMNVINFIDGLDGLAAGTVAIVTGTYAVIAVSFDRTDVAILAAATAGACIGFLPANYRRGGASIFMGDSGSIVLGYIVAVLTLQGSLKTTAGVALSIPLVLLAVPIFDTVFVVLKRIRHKKSPAAADRWHLHHRLLNTGLSPRRATAYLWLWTSSMCSLAFALRYIPYRGPGGDGWNTGPLLLLGAWALVVVGISIWFAIRLEIIKTAHVRRRNETIAAAVRARQHPVQPK